MEKLNNIIRRLESHARHYKKIANDSHTIAEASGYKIALKDLKKFAKQEYMNHNTHYIDLATGKVLKRSKANLKELGYNYD